MEKLELIENEDGSFSMPEVDEGYEYRFVDGEYSLVAVEAEVEAGVEEEVVIDLTTLEGKIIHYGNTINEIAEITGDAEIPLEAKTQMVVDTYADALFQAGDIISALIEKMETSCCTLDETKVKADKNEADIAILKGV